MKTDITIHGHSELADICLNDEFMYNEMINAIRRNNINSLLILIDDMFIYDSEQLDNLYELYNSEREEYNNG